MTQFMLSVHHVPGAAPYASEDDMRTAFAAVEAFNARLIADSALVFVAALHPEADVVTPGDVTAGPAHDGAQLGGFWVVEAADRAAALRLAEQASLACGQPVEVRELEG